VIWAALRAAIYGGLTLAEAIADTYDRGRRILRVFLPRSTDQDAPLPHRDSERQARFARCAGHETDPRCSTLRTPPPKAAPRG